MPEKESFKVTEKTAKYRTEIQQVGLSIESHSPPLRYSSVRVILRMYHARDFRRTRVILVARCVHFAVAMACKTCL